MVHCGYTIFLVKTLTQWLSNVHVAWHELRESNGDEGSHSPVVYVTACGTSVQTLADTSRNCWNVLPHLLSLK